jgi:hypothetical protein
MSRSFIIYIPHHILLGQSNQGGSDLRDMQHTWNIKNLYKILVGISEGSVYHMRELEKIILKGILKN